MAERPVVKVDPRVGTTKKASRVDRLVELCDLLSGCGVSPSIEQLEFGDFQVACHVSYGEDTTVGVELKRVEDLVDSMRSNRLAGHQIPGLLRQHGPGRVWLVIEGQYRARRISGLVEVPRGPGRWVPLDRGTRPVFWGDVQAFLTSAQVEAGIHVCQSRTPRETARLVASLARWWGKPKDAHRTFKGVYDAPAPGLLLRDLDPQTRFLRDVVKGVPGMGWGRSETVVAAFGSVGAMLDATEKDWQNVPGVGKTLAKTLYRFLHDQRPSPRV